MKIFLFFVFFSLLAVHPVKAQTLGGCELIQKAKFKKGRLKICNKTLEVEIADNDILRTIGLMCREGLLENNGMIFVFSEEKQLSFWMKNTKIPLSIGYFNKDKELMDIYDMEPLNESKFYTSKKPALYALETNQGWFKKNKIRSGCKFVLEEISE